MFEYNQINMRKKELICSIDCFIQQTNRRRIVCTLNAPFTKAKETKWKRTSNQYTCKSHPTIPFDLVRVNYLRSLFS